VESRNASMSMKCRREEKGSCSYVNSYSSSYNSMKMGKDAHAYYEFVTTLEVREALFILPADTDVVFR
jgi:hypothetical protein